MLEVGKTTDSTGPEEESRQGAYGHAAATVELAFLGAVLLAAFLISPGQES